MDGKLPEIFWYVFWIFLTIVAFGMAHLAGRSAHQTRMKALDILKMYAEKGAEPPPAMMDRLAEHAFAPEQSHRIKDGRGALIRGFIGFTFMACVLFGVYRWLVDEHAPNWAVYATYAGFSFFAFVAFGLIVAALFIRDPK